MHEHEWLDGSVPNLVPPLLWYCDMPKSAPAICESYRSSKLQIAEGYAMHGALLVWIPREADPEALDEVRSFFQAHEAGDAKCRTSRWGNLPIFLFVVFR